MKDNIKLWNEQNSNNPMYAITISNFVPEGTGKEIIVSSIFGTESAKAPESRQKYERWLYEGEDVFFQTLNSNTNVSETENNTVRIFIDDLKKLLGNEPNSSETDMGYYQFTASAARSRFIGVF